MKRIVLSFSVILVLSQNMFANNCKIMTSPLDLSQMNFGYTNWYSSTVPIVATKTFKYTSFIDAYNNFDKDFTELIKKDVCKKNKWAGVANYKIQWQQTKNTYIFVGTYDVFDDK